jgi:plastocyanin
VTTRRAIRQRLLQESPIGGFNSTSTGGTATTVVDTARLQNTGADSRSWLNMFLYRPAAVAAADSVRTITSHTGSSGTLTHQGANYTNSPTTEIYEVFKGIHPDDLNSAISRAIERLWYETWTPLSLVDDFDMEESGTTQWAVTNATRTKVTTTGYYQDQALQVTCTSANGFAQSNSIPAKPGAFFFAGATVSATAGDKFEFTVRDVTNSATISDVVEETLGVQHTIYFSGTVPADCYQIALRLGGEGSNDITVWDNIIFHVQHQNRFNAPSWLTRRDQLLSVRRQVALGSPVSGAAAQLAYPSDALSWPIIPVAQLEVDPTGTVPLRIVLTEYAWGYPVWVQALRRYSAVTTDTSTLDVDENFAVAAAKVEVFEILNNRHKGRYKTELQQAQRGFGAIARAEAPRGPRTWRPTL